MTNQNPNQNNVPQTPTPANQDNVGDKIIVFIKQTFKLTFKYFWSKTLASIILGFIAFGWLSIINIENPVAISIIVGVSNLVPVVGGLVACIICGIIAIFQSPLSALYVVLSIIVLQQLDQWILTPLIVGKSVSLPPLLICLAILIGGAVWGATGIILAVPVAGAVKVFYMLFVQNKSIDEVENKNKE